MALNGLQRARGKVRDKGLKGTERRNRLWVITEEEVPLLRKSAAFTLMIFLTAKDRPLARGRSYTRGRYYTRTGGGEEKKCFFKFLEVTEYKEIHFSIKYFHKSRWELEERENHMLWKSEGSGFKSHASHLLTTQPRRRRLGGFLCVFLKPL